MSGKDIMKLVDKPLKHNGKKYTVKELIEELDLKDEIEVILGEDNWFETAMENLKEEQ
jgi:hypothetical protein